MTLPLLGALAATFDGERAPVFRSPRAAMSIVGGALPFALSAWLPWVEGSMTRGVCCVALFPLSYAPLYLADPTRGAWAAIVASVDRTLRATLTDHARSAAFVGFMAYGPTTYDRALHGAEPALLLTLALLATAATVASLLTMTRRVRSESVAHRRAGFLGAVGVGAMLLSPLTTIVLFHATVRPHYGPSPRYILVPTSVEHVPDAGGWLVVSTRLRMGGAPWDRSRSFFFTESGGDALLVRLADDGPTLEPVAQGTLEPLAQSSAVSRMLIQLSVLGALGVALIVILLWAARRARRSARLFRESHATRARAQRADVDIGLDEASIAQGASLELEHGGVLVLTRTLPVRGVPIDVDIAELPPSVGVTVLSSSQWSTRESYRHAPTLPSDARAWWGHGVELIERDRQATLDVLLRAACTVTLTATLVLALIV